jgi:LacI family transcriptional regulator
LSELPQHPFVTLRTIGKAAGVAASTVSRALRNHPDVSPAERRRIQELARGMGYRPDPEVGRLMAHLRRARPQRRGARLAFVVPGFTRIAHGRPRTKIEQMIRGAESRASVHGYGLEVFWPRDTPGLTLSRLRRILRARGIVGVVFAPMEQGAEALAFDLDGFAAVAIGYSIRDPNLHRVCAHHFNLMKGAVEELLRRGFRRLGLILLRRFEDGSNNLLSAAFLYEQTRMPRGSEIPILLLEDEAAAPAIADWLAKQRPEVVLAPGQLHAHFAPLGLQIPRDVGFVSLDLADLPSTLAGMDLGHHACGEHAVDLVVSELSLNHVGLPAQPIVTMVPGAWRPGGSLGRPGSRLSTGSIDLRADR